MKISLQEIGVYIHEFLAKLVPYTDHAMCITLSGDLGAGKTTFTQGIARALGVEEHVTSPTFVLEKVYELSGQKWTRLIHIDAYRLVNEHELEVLGWHEMAQDPGNLIIIEWPEMVAELIPTDAIRITISGDGDTREVSVD
jgi:tRNA threonylcarbamoyladenosine biosynthesis protein TsaE